MQCNSCHKTKPLAGFDKQSRAGPSEIWNLRKRCKECIHEAYLARRAKPKRLKAMNNASREWKRRNPERHAALNQEYRARYPEKLIAQNRLAYAVRMGRVKRQPCEVCGETKNIHAHHVSYKPEDWYNVLWRCYVCHALEH